MSRLRLLLLNEFKLARTALPIHIIAIVQPVIFYLLLSLIMVRPTYQMYVLEPGEPVGRDLVQAMREVGDGRGVHYIKPLVIGTDEAVGEPGKTLRQLIQVSSADGRSTALQKYGLIDSNQVKNLRNRLTAAAMRLWNKILGSRAITVEERPWLPEDKPYILFFGMAMLPLSVFMAGVFIGGILTAQEFEHGQVTEYRLAPVGAGWVVGTRIARITMTGLLAGLVLLLVQAFYSGSWPDSLLKVILVLLPLAVTGSSVGLVLGYLLQRSIPALALGLTVTLGSWIVGSAFGLSAGFSGPYQAVSRLMPHTHVVELLFPRYFGAAVGRPWVSILALLLFAAATMAAAFVCYSRQVRAQW